MGVLRAALLLFVCALLQSDPILAAPTTSEVEAVFLFNFSQFVEWPPQAFAEPSSPIVICVLGSDPFGTTLDEVIRGETVQGRALTVRRFQRVEDLTDCQILFISRSEQARLQPILKTLQGRSILTVSDLEEFAGDGGVICFVLVDNKIRLRVNLHAAKAAGLTLSSKLLRPAQIVGPGEP
jgi:YfiR/HmsC-like